MTVSLTLTWDDAPRKFWGWKCYLQSPPTTSIQDLSLSDCFPQGTVCWSKSGARFQTLRLQGYLRSLHFLVLLSLQYCYSLCVSALWISGVGLPCPLQIERPKYPAGATSTCATKVMPSMWMKHLLIKRRSRQIVQDALGNLPQTYRRPFRDINSHRPKRERPQLLMYHPPKKDMYWESKFCSLFRVEQGGNALSFVHANRLPAHFFLNPPTGRPFVPIDTDDSLGLFCLA